MSLLLEEEMMSHMLPAVLKVQFSAALVLQCYRLGDILQEDFFCLYPLTRTLWSWPNCLLLCFLANLHTHLFTLDRQSSIFVLFHGLVYLLEYYVWKVNIPYIKDPFANLDTENLLHKCRLQSLCYSWTFHDILVRLFQVLRQ